MVDVVSFLIAAAIVLGGALGVVGFSNPVHAALSLIASFFGVAVVFIIQEAHFLALVQVVVYAGAIVVLFLFVIMLLGVDTATDLRTEPLVGQRALGLTFGAILLTLILGGLFLSGPGDERGAVALTGQQSVVQPVDDRSQIEQLGEDLFTRNILAFQATALLLTIATVGAVVLVRNEGGEDLVIDEPGSAAD
ncbi:MAG: NADH-quinone oxidoreductase subunit J [Acidimicrobiales bacterium]|nr:NADH-quinone oxidoreductase subunit J [Acidimicrobiales bacterium]